jgi:hypothetical protein
MSIIAINGRVNSGKDSVMYLISAFLFGISKYEMILALEKGTFRDYQQLFFSHSNFKEERFAGPLKEFISMITGLSLHELNNNDVKAKTVLPELGNMTLRKLMVKLGDGLREAVHPNLYAFACKNRYEAAEEPLWIMPDLRLPEEFNFLEQVNNTLKIKVVRQESFTLLNDPREIEYWAHSFYLSFVKYSKYHPGAKGVKDINLQRAFYKDTTLSHAQSENGLNFKKPKDFDVVIENFHGIKELVGNVEEHVMPKVHEFLKKHAKSS